jgi:endonuclease/exonuclease/phosphatase family metal-dependent hydrolase
MVTKGISSVKLIQLNIWQGRIISHVVRFLAAEQPDIVCLQEVYSSAEQLPGWNSFSGLEAIRAQFPEYHCFFAPVSAHSVMGKRVVYGNAILSRLPVGEEQIGFTNGEYVDDLDKQYLDNIRNYQTCTITLPDGKKLSVVNHHGYWDKNPLGTHETIASMEIAKQAAQALPNPVIMTGDLNVTDESPAMRVFDGFLEDLTTTRGVKTTLTQLARAFDNNNMVPCDHILVSPEVVVQNFTVSDEIMSDHKAVILDFTL